MGIESSRDGAPRHRRTQIRYKPDIDCLRMHMELEDNAIFRYNPPSNHETANVLFFMTDGMVECFQRCGQFVIMLNISNENRFNREMFLVCGFNENTQFVLFAVAWVKADAQASFEFIFNEMRKAVGNDAWNRMRSITLSGSDPFKAALNKAAPLVKTRQYLPPVLHRLKDLGLNSKEAICLFDQCVEAKTEEKFDQCWNLLRKHPETPELGQFLDQLSESRSQWALAFAFGITNFGQFLTKSPKPLVKLIDMFDYESETQITFRRVWNRLTSTTEYRSDRPSFRLIEEPNAEVTYESLSKGALTESAQGLCKKEYACHQLYTATKINKASSSNSSNKDLFPTPTNAFIVHLTHPKKKPLEQEPHYEVHVTPSFAYCPCGYGSTYLLPCRHVLAANVAAQMDAFLLPQYHPRWRKVYDTYELKDPIKVTASKHGWKLLQVEMKDGVMRGMPGDETLADESNEFEEVASESNEMELGEEDYNDDDEEVVEDKEDEAMWFAKMDAFMANKEKERNSAQTTGKRKRSITESGVSKRVAIESPAVAAAAAAAAAASRYGIVPGNAAAIAGSQSSQGSFIQSLKSQAIKQAKSMLLADIEPSYRVEEIIKGRFGKDVLSRDEWSELRRQMSIQNGTYESDKNWKTLFDRQQVEDSEGCGAAIEYGMNGLQFTQTRFASRAMILSFRQCGQFTMMHCSRSSRFGRYIFTMSGYDKDMNFVLFALAVFKDLTRENVQKALEFCKKSMHSEWWERMVCVATDGGEILTSVLSAVAPHVVQQRCVWQLQKDIQNAAAQIFPSFDYHPIIAQWRKSVIAKTEVEFTQQWQALISTVSLPTVMRDHFVQNVFPLRNKWAAAWTRGNTTFLNYVSYRVEPLAQFLQMCHASSSTVPVSEVVDRLCNVTGEEHNHIARDPSHLKMEVENTMDESDPVGNAFKKKGREHLSAAAIVLSKSEYRTVEQYTARFVEVNEISNTRTFFVRPKADSASLNDNSYLVYVSQTVVYCPCGYCSTLLMPCRHVMAANVATGMDVCEPKQYHPRWLLKYHADLMRSTLSAQFWSRQETVPCDANGRVFYRGKAPPVLLPPRAHQSFQDTCENEFRRLPFPRHSPRRDEYFKNKDDNCSIPSYSEQQALKEFKRKLEAGISLQ